MFLRNRKSKWAWPLTFSSLSILLGFKVWATSDFSIGVGQVTLPDAVETIGGVGGPSSSVIVNFPVGAFDTTPVVFILPDNTNPDPMTFRVHSVSTTGFEVFVSEPQGEDGTDWPAPIPFEYLAIEPGIYSVGGATIEVGLETNVTAFQGSQVGGGTSFQTVNFASPFMGTAPAVISELQTLRSDTTLLSGAGSTFTRVTEPWLEVAMSNLNTTSFQVALERAETSIGTIAGTGEDIAWLAIDDTTDISFTDDSLNSIDLKAFLSGATAITGNCIATNLVTAGVTSFSSIDPIYFGSQVRRNGGDGGWTRNCSDNAISVTVETAEDMANDGETGHTGEQVAFIAFSEEFQTTDTGAGSLGFNMLIGSETIVRPGVTSFSYDLAPTSVSFNTLFGGNFSATPVVIPMSTDEGNDDPAMIRVWDITSSGFTMSVTVPEGTVAPDGTPRAPDGMTVDFLVAVPGSHILPDGTEILAAFGTTNRCIGGQSACATGAASYINVPLSFATPPADAAVFAAAQTIANDPGFDPEDASNPLLSTSIINKSGTSFDFSFELAQTDLGSANPLAFNETFGWVALPVGLESELRAAQGTTGTGEHIIEYKTLFTPASIQGWTDAGGNCFLFNYTTAFSSASTPHVIATHNTRNGADGGWLRRCDTTGTGVRLVIDEDTAFDTERAHGSSESASIISFSDTFAWGPLSYRNTKTIETEWDPINLFDNPKAIPGAFNRYTVTIENLERIGADDSALEIIDAIPTATTLFVGDLDSAGCPIEFIDGSDPSGLTFNCASDLRFFTDGTCAPADPDGFCAFSTFTFAGDWDSTITSLKIAPTGEFLGSDGTTTPSFEFDFRVRLD